MEQFITYYSPTGEIRCRGRYSTAVEKLCVLEEQLNPKERYTFRIKSDGNAAPRRGIELVLGRLYDYEHS